MEREAPVSERSQIILVWVSIVMAVIFGVALGFLLRMIPPPSATQTAEQVKEWYLARQTPIKLGATITSWSSAFLLPFWAVIGIQIWREERGRPIWTVLSLMSGATMTMQNTTGPIAIAGLAHIGVRVHDLERSVRFYELLGFTKIAGPIGPEPVAILDHPSGLELNLILNAPSADAPNVLMDVAEKHPGITHVALLCGDLADAQKRLVAAGIPLSGGPVRFGPAAQAIFVRDPDRNVIELHQRG